MEGLRSVLMLMLMFTRSSVSSRYPSPKAVAHSGVATPKVAKDTRTYLAVPHILAIDGQRPLT